MSLAAKEIDDAWGVIGASNAGRNARTKLLQVLSGICNDPDNVSALSRHEGKRILARELLELMDASFKDGRGGDDEYPDSPKRQPVSYAGSGAGRSLRRVTLTDADRSDPSRADR